jgi:transposase
MELTPVRKKRTRRNHTPEQKLEMLRRHFVDKVPVSDLCDELKLQPSLLYIWQQQLFARGGAAFETSTKPSREKELEAKVAALEEKLSKKDGVIAEVTAEYVQLKKELGEL